MGGVQTHPLRSDWAEAGKKAQKPSGRRKVALLMEENGKCLEEDQKEAEQERQDSACCGPRWGKEEVLTQR